MSISRQPAETLLQGYLVGDQQAINTLRTDMEELVRRIARLYVSYATEEELLPVGMTYFDVALEKYAERRRKNDVVGKPLYKFSTYFTWWIKQSIETYLDLNPEARLRRIVPR